jgi:Leucine-rich repeat (LRR) protein
VHALRHFKSEANAELLRSLLAEPLEEFESGFVAQYPLRAKAFEILLHWRLETPLPSSPEEITSLDLSGTQVADAGLKQVARLKNLARLELQSTPVTAAGLRELAGLTRISELHLGESQLSDANLRALREIGLLHVVYQAEAKDAERPRSMEEVRSLALCRSPVTDAGLKELAGMQNLTWLDLRDTQVTDAGLKELVRFKQLGRLLLQGTRVTNAGVAELRKTLPQCEVVRE